MSMAATLRPVRRLVAVTAHPDDESFGLGGVIASLTRAGATASLVCFTRGEASTLGASPDLPVRRGRELAAAAAELGIERVHLLDHPDGRLSEVPTAELVEALERHLDGVDAILTFDTSGVSGHPDHQAATRAALTAGRRRDLPVLAWTIPMQLAEQLNAELGTTFVGSPTHEIDLVVTADRSAQLAAMAHHDSQLDGNSVPIRRLEAQGPVEHLRLLHDPRGRSGDRDEPTTSNRT
jgi:N-acetylglucosamine malate deacetylase 2